MTNTTNATATLKGMMKFNARIARLDADLRRGFELLFHNPTDACVPVFDMFLAADAVEELADLLDTAELFGLEHADLVSSRLTRWMNEPMSSDSLASWLLANEVY